jgi:hypothetical protein
MNMENLVEINPIIPINVLDRRIVEKVRYERYMAHEIIHTTMFMRRFTVLRSKSIAAMSSTISANK